MCTPTSRQAAPDEARTLLDDHRGAIMVVAVFMAAFLVGALWYIIGIGDTILYRERMQDGADAVAYAGAVYHARGMNLIAMINIIMAGLLAVLIALKLVQIMNIIANVISCMIAAACAVGAGCWAVPICTLTTNLEKPISTAISDYTDFLKPTLKGLSKAEKGIAIAMPWVAEGKAVYVATKYYNKPVKTGGIISASMLPQGWREGLPVQEAPYASLDPTLIKTSLCWRAGKFLGNVITLPFGSWGNWVGGVVGGIADTFPGYFCGAGGALGVDLKQSAVGQLCAQKQDTFDKQHKGEKNPPKFDMGKCKKNGQKDMSKEVAKKVGKLKGVAGSMDATTMTPKRVYQEAENGNGYFQVWSVVVGDDEWPKQDDNGVKIAAWGKQFTMPSMPWGKVGFAEAEFYYDWHGKWEDYRQDAMWHMLWRARFRRVRPPTPNVATVLGSVLGNKLANKFGAQASKLLKNDSFLGYAIGTSAANKFGYEMRSVLMSGGSWVDDKIQDKVLEQYDKLQVIH